MAPHRPLLILSAVAVGAAALNLLAKRHSTMKTRRGHRPGSSAPDSVYRRDDDPALDPDLYTPAQRLALLEDGRRRDAQEAARLQGRSETGTRKVRS